jgi:hypothetical protein
MIVGMMKKWGICMIEFNIIYFPRKMGHNLSIMIIFGGSLYFNEYLRNNKKGFPITL